MTRSIKLRVTFVHEDTHFTVPIAFCVLDSPDYRFLLGLDVLRPLKFSMRAGTIRLIHPRMQQSAVFPLLEGKPSKVHMVFVGSAASSEPSLPPAMKGDMRTIFHAPVRLSLKGGQRHPLLAPRFILEGGGVSRGFGHEGGRQSIFAVEQVVPPHACAAIPSVLRWCRALRHSCPRVVEGRCTLAAKFSDWGLSDVAPDSPLQNS
jgi:hypothetical protein